MIWDDPRDAVSSVKKISLDGFLQGAGKRMRATHARMRARALAHVR